MYVHLALQDKINAAKGVRMDFRKTSAQKPARSKTIPKRTSDASPPAKHHKAHRKRVHPPVNLAHIDTHDDNPVTHTHDMDIGQINSEPNSPIQYNDSYTNALHHSPQPQLRIRVKGRSRLKSLLQPLEDSDTNSDQAPTPKHACPFTDSEDDDDILYQNTSKATTSQTPKPTHTTTTSTSHKSTSKSSKSHTALNQSNKTAFHAKLDGIIASNPKAKTALAKVDKYVAKTLRPDRKSVV